MIKAIIFDLDGTLIDTEFVAHNATEKAFSQFGYKLNPEDFDWLNARHPKDFVPILVEKYKWDESKVGDIIKSFRTDYHLSWDSEVSLKKNAKDVCTALLSKGMNLSLVTTSGDLTVEKFIKKFGFENIFSEITTSDHVENVKPDPEPYILAKSKLKYPTEEILVIEDSYSGLLSAKGAGLKVAVIPSEYTKRQDFSSADYYLNELSDILNIN